jgi:Uma2 family endonuclease
VAAFTDADDQHRYELTGGNLVVMPPPTWRHQEISMLLTLWLLKNGFEERANFGSGLRTADDNHNGRIPDVVVSKRPIPPETVWLDPESVLLVVEVVSPGSERTDRWFKPIEYAETGIRHFWRIEPDESVLRYRLSGGTYVPVGKEIFEELLRGAVPDLD